MDLLPTKAALLELLNLGKNQPAVVSIYTPTHQASTSQSLNADKARFKNALQEAQNELKGEGLKRNQIPSILDGAWELYEDLDFWQHRGRALAVFLAPDELKWYRLPIETDELMHIGKRFVLAPLCVTANMPGINYVLKLNLKEPKLFLASWHMFEEVKLEAMPGEMEEALKISGYEQEQQHQSMGNSRERGMGKGDAVYHGHGGAKDNRTDMVRDYLRLVDEAVTLNPLKYPDAPLITAGNTEHTAMFNSISGKNIGHTIKKEFVSEEELREHVIEYLNNQLELEAEEFMDSQQSGDLPYEDYSIDQLKEMAVRGQIKRLGVGMLNSTRDSVRDVKDRITKLDLNMDRDWLGEVEKLIHAVLSHGGEITGTFIKDGKRDLQAMLRYRT